MSEVTSLTAEPSSQSTEGTESGRMTESEVRDLILGGVRRYRRAEASGLLGDWTCADDIIFLSPAEIDYFRAQPHEELKVAPGDMLHFLEDLRINLSSANQAEYEGILSAMGGGQPNIIEATEIFQDYDTGRRARIAQLLDIASKLTEEGRREEVALCLLLTQEQIIWRQDMERWLENRTPRPLIQLGNPWGKREARPVDLDSESDRIELQRLAEDMKAVNEMIVSYYASSDKPSFLHASQVGSDMDVICMRHQPDPSKEAIYTIIVNPNIYFGESAEVEQARAYEGCYAFFEGRAFVPRPMPQGDIILEVEGFDINAEPIHLSLGVDDIQTARLIQHEADHGRGLSVVDRVINPHDDIQTDLLAYYRNKYSGQEDAEERAKLSAAEAMALVFFLKRVPRRDKEGVYYIPGPGGMPLELSISLPFYKQSIIEAIQKALTNQSY